MPLLPSTAQNSTVTITFSRRHDILDTEDGVEAEAERLDEHNDEEDSEHEGERMVKRLQKASVTLDKRLEESEVQLFKVRAVQF